jgi:hypothetical protein
MRRTKEGVPLVQAAAVQPEFEFHNISGTLVSFWTAEYAKSLNVPGYHLHFISVERAHGGHVLQWRGKKLSLQIQREGDYHIVLPAMRDMGLKTVLLSGNARDVTTLVGRDLGVDEAVGGKGNAVSKIRTPCRRFPLQRPSGEKTQIAGRRA